MIEEDLYQGYLKALLAGRRSECKDDVNHLLDKGAPLRDLYVKLFQRSMYEVGELWETNQITVANEHLATSVTESLLTVVYQDVFATERVGRKAVISCAANEFHQIGGKIVADMLEVNGWDAHFVGANTPVEDLVKHVGEVRPDMVGLSLSILSNMDHLKRCIEAVRSEFPNMDLLVGGQAFRWGGIDTIKQYSGTLVIASLDDLEKMIKES